MRILVTIPLKVAKLLTLKFDLLLKRFNQGFNIQNNEIELSYDKIFHMEPYFASLTVKFDLLF